MFGGWNGGRAVGVGWHDASPIGRQDGGGVRWRVGAGVGTFGAAAAPHAARRANEGRRPRATVRDKASIGEDDPRGEHGCEPPRREGSMDASGRA